MEGVAPMFSGVVSWKARRKALRNKNERVSVPWCSLICLRSVEMVCNILELSLEKRNLEVGAKNICKLL